APYLVGDFEVASRLSFFLWSSIPDDRLLEQATKGRLKDAAVLEREARRMFAGPRSSALVDNFFTPWLELRTPPAPSPDGATFPEFDDTLRASMQREAELFLRSQLSEDRPIADLFTANYTFLNERLARHYGIPGVSGSEFRRVTVADDARIGLLGKGGIL